MACRLVGAKPSIILTNAGILLFRTLGTNSSEILSEIHAFSFYEMAVILSRPHCSNGTRVITPSEWPSRIWVRTSHGFIQNWCSDHSETKHVETMCIFHGIYGVYPCTQFSFCVYISGSILLNIYLSTPCFLLFLHQKYIYGTCTNSWLKYEYGQRVDNNLQSNRLKGYP